MKRILIIEDQTDIRELIRMTLELEDFDIHDAENGDLGLQLAKSLRPDLILLDVMMPGTLNGYQVCEAVRADPGLAKCKVVMLSARSQEADRATGLRAGADDYLVKPFSPRELLQVVDRIL